MISRRFCHLHHLWTMQLPGSELRCIICCWSSIACVDICIWLSSILFWIELRSCWLWPFVRCHVLMLCQYQYWDIVDVTCAIVLRPPSEVAELAISDWVPEFPFLGLGPLGHEITSLNFLYALSLTKKALALIHHRLFWFLLLIEFRWLNWSSELRWIRGLTFKTLASREDRRFLPTFGQRLAIGLNSE